ncbi:MAG: DUF2339 domain-containing protein [Candidatus Taylorbacteria bacterium]
MSALLIVILFIMFFYLLSRVKEVERRMGEIGNVKSAPRESSGETQSQVPQQVISSTPSPMSSPTPVVSQTMQGQPASAVLPTKKKEGDGNTEFALGSKVMTGVGALALLLGIGFFLRYAFENNLISELNRVIFGVIFGIVVVGLGHFLRKKYATYGYTLVGAGLGILYLSLYAAYSFYSLLSMPVAFTLLFVVTALGVGGSLLYDSKVLVSYSFLGAFIIPFILPLSLSVHVLFVYLLVINSGVLLVARFKVWPELTLGSLLGTSLIYLRWVIGPYTDALFAITLFYSTLLFLIYFTTSLLNFVFRDRQYKGIDGFLLYGIPIIYFLLNLTIIRGNNDTALFALLIGIFYIAISLGVRAGFSAVGELTRFSNAMLFIATPFIALATAIHFDGSTVTVVWAIEAVVMVLVGYLLKTSSNRVGGIILAILTGMKMVLFDFGMPLNAVAIFNSRSATVAIVALMFATLMWVYMKIENIGGDEKTAGRFVGSIGLFATLFLWLSFEAHDFLPDYLLYLPLIYIIFGTLALSFSFVVREKIIRFLSYLVVFLAFSFALAFQSDLDLSRFSSLFNIRVLTGLAAALFTAFLMWLFKANAVDVSNDERKIVKVFLTAANLLVLWAFTSEILGYYNMKFQVLNDVGIENTKRVVLSGFWLVYALSAMAVGIFRRSIFARYLSIILFAVTIFKIFLYDTANLSDVYRFVSFISLGVILLITGFAYYKFKDRITEFVRIPNEPANKV